MKRNLRNLRCHELLGLKVKVLSSTDPGVVGLEGVIVDETMKTFRIRSMDSGRIRMVFKLGSVFSIYIPELNRYVDIDGDLLVGRPEDRVRRCW